ncbi:ECF-type sigma factor [Solilutibacter tolerans]|uniref:ECF-type sigma factor n=1 Tax=Solilutibacter tolerans TaxID=1604334 RepID=UPI000970A77C|nr:ECF-type sigma factor [Lysobacter tolerans]
MQPTPPQVEVTVLLARARAGDAGALDAAYAAVYDELRRTARRELRRMRDDFQTTALVNESYLKLAGGTPLAAVDRNHLLALSARAMRQVLVDDARARKADKRGGGLKALTLTASLGSAEQAAHDVLALDEMLTSLHKLDARAAQIVELRFFGGYEETEIAQMLELSDRTVRRDWRKARAFLLNQLES